MFTEIEASQARIAGLTEQIERTESRISQHEQKGEHAFAAGEASHLSVLVGRLAEERARLDYFAGVL